MVYWVLYNSIMFRDCLSGHTLSMQLIEKNRIEITNVSCSHDNEVAIELRSLKLSQFPTPKMDWRRSDQNRNHPSTRGNGTATSRDNAYVSLPRVPYRTTSFKNLLIEIIVIRNVLMF